MHKISRRSFLAAGAGLSVMPFPAWFEKYAAAQGAATATRFDVSSTAGKQMLNKYAHAVKQMKALPEGDPRSWVFQWYTHWVKGTTTKQNELNRIYPNPSDPNRAIAVKMWDTCQAHGPGMDENMFLPWHRMFVYFFEHIIRSVLNDSSFTLPYWNYSRANAHAIPPQFHMQGDPTFGSLFRPNRNPGVNQGQPIDQGQPDNPLGLQALAQLTYKPQGAAQGFCAALDLGLHGNVHVLVGNSTNMGNIPFAANDPVFWMHHCNIDRLWASWNRAGRQNPTNDAAWLNQTFTFVDVHNNQVVQVVAKVQDFDDIAKLRYTYDHFEPVPGATGPVAAAPGTESMSAAAAVPSPTPLAAVAGNVTLETEPVRVTLGPPNAAGPTPTTTAAPSAAAPSQPLGLAARVAALPGNRRLYLVLRHLRADLQPGVLYHVYLDLPEDVEPTDEEAHHVGTINFFDAAAHGDHQAAAPQPEKFYSFDITAKAKELQERGQLTANPAVTIVPVGSPVSEAKPAVGEITVQEQ